MPFTTGTAKTPAALLNALNTFLTANGWTKLRGDTDMAMSSPKATRYWRMIATRSGYINYFGLNRLHFRTTPGGANIATNPANWSAEFTSGSASTLISGGTNRASFRNMWIIEYDFGAPTIVREIAMTGDTDPLYSPSDFAIQWSHDRVTWNNMESRTGLSWTATELKTFTYADGFVSTIHPDSTSPFRAGRLEDQNVTAFAVNGVGRHCNNDVWSWQGPGYDASRRVYIHMRGHFQPSVTSGTIEMWAGTAYNSAQLNPNFQPGTDSGPRVLMLNSSTVTYWFYANSYRVVIVVKSGALNYTSAYVGFLGAFVQPEFFPFPLAVIGTGNNWLTTFDTANNHHSSIVDPGTDMFSYRRWDAQWLPGRGRANGGAGDNNTSSTAGQRCGVWPAYNMGATNGNQWPGSGGTGNTTPGTGRLIDRLVPTLQNELPMLPAIMMDSDFGNIGTLADVYVTPSGGLLVPEQTLTIGSDTYRVFPNRDRRTNADWFAIKEAA